MSFQTAVKASYFRVRSRIDAQIAFAVGAETKSRPEPVKLGKLTLPNSPSVLVLLRDGGFSAWRRVSYVLEYAKRAVLSRGE
jgi:hypothetical protein